MGLFGVSSNICFAVLWVGLMMEGLADLTQCVIGVVLGWGVGTLGAGWWELTALSGSWCDMFPVQEKFTTTSDRFLMVMLAVASSVQAFESLSLSALAIVVSLVAVMVSYDILEAVTSPVSWL